MKKLNILVTTVGGLTSPDILKSYKSNNEYTINIVGTDAFEFAVGKKFVDHFEILPSSKNDELNFISQLEKLVKKYKVDVIIPCGNDDNLIISKHKDLISCRIMASDYKDLLIAYDKAKVYEELKNNILNHSPKFNIVNSYESFLKGLSDLEYPEKKVVIKPRFGIGGRGVYILSDKFDYKKIFGSKPTNEYPLEFFEKILKNQKSFDDLILMECLSDPFYSIYSICKGGKNIFTLTHLRDWGNSSQTFRGKVYYDEKIENLASKIISKFNLSYTNNMELAMSADGRLVLFDLNPRIGASSGIDREIGFNFPLESIKLALGEKIVVEKSKFKQPKKFIRYFDHVWS